MRISRGGCVTINRERAMMMKKDEADLLMKALQSALDPEEWAVRRDGKRWYIVCQSDSRKMELPAHELKDELDRLEKQEEKDKAVQAFVSRVTRALPATEQSIRLREQQHMIYPVMRTAAFPTGETAGKRLLKREHTAESIVLYALDFGESYVLVNEEMARDAEVTTDEVHRWALHNVKQLPNEPKLDFVADNRFYFFSHDHYAASRILNDKLLYDLQKKITGEMIAAIPHQDVLIVADVRNSAGYDVISRLAMKFYGEGHIPITPMPLMVEENRELTPIFVMPEAIKQKKMFK